MTSNILCFPATSGGVDFCSQTATDLYMAPLDVKTLGRAAPPLPRSARNRIPMKSGAGGSMKPEFQDVHIDLNGNEVELYPDIPAVEEEAAKHFKMNSVPSKEYPGMDFNVADPPTSSEASMCSTSQSNDQLENAATEFQKSREISQMQQASNFVPEISKTDDPTSKVAVTVDTHLVPETNDHCRPENRKTEVYSDSTGRSSNTSSEVSKEPKRLNEEPTTAAGKSSTGGGFFSMCRGLGRRASVEDFSPHDAQDNWPDIVEGSSHRVTVSPRSNRSARQSKMVCCGPHEDSMSLEGKHERRTSVSLESKHEQTTSVPAIEDTTPYDRALHSKLNDRAVALLHELELEQAEGITQTFFAEIPAEYIKGGLKSIRTGDTTWNSPLVHFVSSPSTNDVGQIAMSLSTTPQKSLVAQYHRVFTNAPPNGTSVKSSTIIWLMTYIIRDLRSGKTEIKNDKWVSFASGSSLPPLKIQQGFSVNASHEHCNISVYAVATERKNGASGFLADVENAYVLQQNSNHLVANGHSYHILSDVVQARSNLLQCATKSNDSGYVLENPAVTQAEFKNLIDYVHTDRCDILESHDCDELSRLLKAAETYKVERLKAEIRLRILECGEEEALRKYSDILV